MSRSAYLLSLLVSLVEAPEPDWARITAVSEEFLSDEESPPTVRVWDGKIPDFLPPEE